LLRMSFVWKLSVLMALAAAIATLSSTRSQVRSQVLDGWEEELREQLWHSESCHVRAVQIAQRTINRLVVRASCRDDRKFLAVREGREEEFTLRECPGGRCLPQ